MSGKNLPIVGASEDSWGQELGDFITETHEPSGAGGGDFKSGLRINTANLNEAVDLTATSTQLNTLTDGTTGTDITPLHQHSLAKGAVDVTTSSEEINIALDGVNTEYVTATNLTQVTDGSNADSLHTHTDIDIDISKFKISSNDTIPDYVVNKIIAGSNITLTENNDGGNETLTVAVTAIPDFSQVTLTQLPSAGNQVATRKYADDLFSASPDWQNSVISKTLTEAPTANMGDRYLVGTPVVSGDAWYMYDNNIVEYNGTWTDTPSGEGQAVWVKDEDSMYYNNGSGWLDLTAVITPATTASIGSVELATIDEIDIGTDNTRAITPLGLAGSSQTGGGVNVNWIRASQIGSDLNIASASFPALAALNVTDVSFIDASIEELRTYRFNGSTWTEVGSGLSISTIGTPALAALNETDVVFIDSTNIDLRTYRFSGSTWTQVGSGLNIAGMGAPRLASLNSTDVVLIDSNSNTLQTYRFTDPNWAELGSGLFIASVGNPSVTTLNGTDIAFIDDVNKDLRTYRFNGSTWSQVGSDLNISGIGNGISITALNSTDIAIIDNTINNISIYRWGTATETWAKIGDDLSISAIGWSALTSLNGTDVAFIDHINGDLRTYRFAFSFGYPYRP